MSMVSQRFGCESNSKSFSDRLGQGKRDVGIAIFTLFAKLVAGGGDDDILAAIDLVGCRRRNPDPREFARPEFRASVFVERADFCVAGSGTEQQAAGGGDGPARIFRSGLDRKSVV